MVYTNCLPLPEELELYVFKIRKELDIVEETKKNYKNVLTTIEKLNEIVMDEDINDVGIAYEDFTLEELYDYADPEDYSNWNKAEQLLFASVDFEFMAIGMVDPRFVEHTIYRL